MMRGSQREGVAAVDYDVAIIGGGMVGASLARALAQAGVRTAVVEAWSVESQRQPSYDDRAIALAYGTRRILEGLGVWETLAPDAQPILHIHVSNKGHFGFTRLHHHEMEVDALGYVATGNTLGSALFQGLERLPHLDLFCPAVLSQFEVGADRVDLTVEMNGEVRQLSARLLVAADGARSTVRQRLGIGVREWGYGQSAIISNITPGLPPAGVAFERFTAEGPLAMLPLTENRCGLVWTVNDERLPEAAALDDHGFLARVQANFGNRLGRLQRAGRRSVYPLKFLQAKEHVRPRVALIGNAAHAVHPITGQGFNLGIRDAAVLADVLVDALRTGGDPGDLPVLEGYARWRHRDQQAVAMLTDGLVRLFTNPLPPIGVVRNLGMLALDVAPAAKRLLTRQFMGLNGRLPRLARGLAVER